MWIQKFENNSNFWTYKVKEASSYMIDEVKRGFKNPIGGMKYNGGIVKKVLQIFDTDIKSYRYENNL